MEAIEQSAPTQDEESSQKTFEKPIIAGLQEETDIVRTDIEMPMEVIEQSEPNSDKSMEKSPVANISPENISGKENDSSVPHIKAEPQDETNAEGNDIEIPMHTIGQSTPCRDEESSQTTFEKPITPAIIVGLQEETDIEIPMNAVEQSETTHDQRSPDNTSETLLTSAHLENNIRGEENSLPGPNIKTEPQDETNIVNNDIEMPMAPETQEKNVAANLEAPMETSTVTTIKKDPNNDEIPIDKDMPIAKDSDYLNNIPFATPVPTEDFLDGIATAIAPKRPMRLRVKSEFSLRENFSIPEASLEANRHPSDVNDQRSNSLLNEETPPPPPPPSLSSNSTSEFLADGIATPRISLLALKRLKIKTELPQSAEEESSVIPDDFFSDLLKAKSPKEAGEVSASGSDTDSDDIPPDYFDDLLRPNIEQAADNNEFEEKYSDRLKEKERLKSAYKASMEKSKDKRRHHKKQKKSKKKSRKRSRSRSPVHDREHRNRDHRSASPAVYHKENKRSRHSSTSQDVQDEEFKRSDSLWASKSCIRVKQEFENSEQNQTPPETTLMESIEEINEVLTPKQKRERAIKRATALLNHLRNSSSSDNLITSTFEFVSTTRKLPTSHSYVQQQIYENRSPLHTVNNVSYKFNSHATRFNMEEWGLAALSPHATKIAKLIGIDAQFIYEKLKTIKIPPQLKKIKTENMEQTEEDGEELVEAHSSLFCNVMTQTDDDIEGDTRSKGKGYDIGVQAVPSAFSIGTQTLETQSPTKNSHKDDDSPLMNIIRDLNENQLMAIHSFAELIKEPAPNANAMDMYKIQMKIMEIYKISQIPSALNTTPVTNNYTTNYSSTSQRRNFTLSNPIIQSVKSADGTQFSINDPRASSSAYAGRIINNHNDEVASSSHVDPRIGNSQYLHRNSSRPSVHESRYHGSTHPNQASASTYRQHQQTHMNYQPPTSSPTAKRYGRGALRR